MKVLVTGVNGQLGHDCFNELCRRGHTTIASGNAARYTGIQDGSAVTAAPYVPLDITDRNSVIAVMEKYCPDAVVHCAAWTAVDAAEMVENQAKVEAVNHLGTRYLAEAVKELNAKMLYISTDYVFNGKGERPWRPDDTNFAPLNYYGKTKLEGEFAVRELMDNYFIVRISWAFGLNGGNFVKTMIRVGKTHDSVRVVYDQIGTPTYTWDLALSLADMVESEKYGIYHATNEGGYISWYDFCCEIFRQYGLNTTVIPISTEDYGRTEAVRPLNSRLDKSKLAEAGFQPLPPWPDAVNRYLKEAKL